MLVVFKHKFGTNIQLQTAWKSVSMQEHPTKQAAMQHSTTVCFPTVKRTVTEYWRQNRRPSTQDCSFYWLTAAASGVLMQSEPDRPLGKTHTAAKADNGKSNQQQAYLISVSAASLHCKQTITITLVGLDAGNGQST